MIYKITRIHKDHNSETSELLGLEIPAENVSKVERYKPRARERGLGRWHVLDFLHPNSARAFYLICQFKIILSDEEKLAKLKEERVSWV